MDSKIIGYSSLTVGLILIVFSVFHLYRVLTGQTQPPRVSASHGLSIQLNNHSPAMAIISPQEANQLIDLALYYLLLTFLVSVGFRFCHLGSSFLRPINVSLRGDSPAPKPNQPASSPLA